MSSDAPTLAVPIILCGKLGPVAQKVMEGLAPEYDVIHVIHDTDAGRAELPQLLAGEAIRPSSGLGSNARNASISMTGRAPAPRCVVVGGGFTADEYAALRGVAGAGTVPFVGPAEGFVGMAAGGRPEPEAIAARIKDALRRNGLVPGKTDVPGDGAEWTF